MLEIGSDLFTFQDAGFPGRTAHHRLQEDALGRGYLDADS